MLIAQDERAMQLFGLANTLLARDHDLVPRHYSIQVRRSAPSCSLFQRTHTLMNSYLFCKYFLSLWHALLAAVA